MLIRTGLVIWTPWKWGWCYQDISQLGYKNRVGYLNKPWKWGWCYLDISQLRSSAWNLLALGQTNVLYKAFGIFMNNSKQIITLLCNPCQNRLINSFIPNNIISRYVWDEMKDMGLISTVVIILIVYPSGLICILSLSFLPHDYGCHYGNERDTSLSMFWINCCMIGMKECGIL